MLRKLKLEKRYKLLIKYGIRNQGQSYKKRERKKEKKWKIRPQKRKVIPEINLRDRKMGNFRNVCLSVWQIGELKPGRRKEWGHHEITKLLLGKLLLPNKEN